MKEIAVVYMVAGVSSRFGGKIKQFEKVNRDETLIEYSLNQAIKAGFNKIIFIVGNKTEQPFKDLFKNSYRGIPVIYAYQKFNPEERDKPWGTTDSLCCINEIIDCPFVVCNGDDIYGENTFKTLFKHLQESQEEATMGYLLETVTPESGSVKRAIFQVEGGHVRKLVEIFGITKLDFKASGTKPDDLCSMNIFALHPKTVELLNEKLLKFKKDNQGNRSIESLLPNDISELVESNKIKMKIYPSTDKWKGITNPGDELAVREEIKKEMKNGK